MAPNPPPAARAGSHKRLLVPWIYDLGLWMFALCLDIFFREVYARSAFRVPKRGPCIIIAAPHANQFVDSVLLMRILKQAVGRRVSFLIAEKSMREPYIGPLAAMMGALPVVRAMDNVKPGAGLIYLPDPDGDPTLVRGRGTDFTDASLYMVGGQLILPKVGSESPEQQPIAEILGPEELRLRKPFKAFEPGTQLHTALRGEGTSFKVAPHIDQSRMFNAVYTSLCDGGCIGIFPEGGSHDRPSLLPLKAGAAIIALGTLARDPECGLSIIPCGMNYFHPNKFRSRAVVEFGNPIQVSAEQVAAFSAGGQAKRNAVGSLLETITEALAAVTQQAPDHETLMLAQATRRLYAPLRAKLPLPVVVELNRRLLEGYTKLRDQPEVVRLTKAVAAYNRELRALGIKDHQVEWGNFEERPWWRVLGTLLWRVGELALLCAGTLPSLALFWPVFVTAKAISAKKQRKALAGSVVKLQARDVVGTWKILVAMGLAPALYLWYTTVVTGWLWYCRGGGSYCAASVVPWWMDAQTWVPAFVPLKAFAVAFFGLMIAVTFAGLRVGEIGIDVLKSLPPLLVALNPASAPSLVKLRAQRQALARQVVEVVDAFGPEVIPDFEEERLVTEEERKRYGYEDGERAAATYESELKTMPPGSEPVSRRGSDIGLADASGAREITTSVGGFLAVGSGNDLGEVNKRMKESVLREREKRRSMEKNEL